MNKESEENIRMIRFIATYLEDRDESPLAAKDMLKLIPIISKHDVLIAERDILAKRLQGAEECAFNAMNERNILVTKLSDARQDAENWKSEYEMFANAWLREIGGKIIPKTHLIDALVLTTREVVKERDELSEKLKKATADLAGERSVRVQVVNQLGDALDKLQAIVEEIKMPINNPEMYHREIYGWSKYLLAVIKRMDKGKRDE